MILAISHIRSHTQALYSPKHVYPLLSGFRFLIHHDYIFNQQLFNYKIEIVNSTFFSFQTVGFTSYINLKKTQIGRAHD